MGTSGIPTSNTSEPAEGDEVSSQPSSIVQSR
jgi:hypothetical protein